MIPGEKSDSISSRFGAFWEDGKGGETAIPDPWGSVCPQTNKTDIKTTKIEQKNRIMDIHAFSTVGD